jgi:phosphate-selective porin OprO and OprP
MNLTLSSSSAMKVSDPTPRILFLLGICFSLFFSQSILPQENPFFPEEGESKESNSPKTNELEPENAKKPESEKNFNPHWFTSKMGEGFTITSDDGESLINLRIRAQLRATQTVVPEDRSQDNTNFTTRRMRLMARGKLKGDEWHYYVQLGFANQDMESDRPIPLRDSILTYNGWKSVKFTFGQMKVPFNRQRINSSSALQLVDRSIVNAELNLDRDVGVQMFTHDLFGLSKNFAVNVGVFGGDGRNRTATGSGVLTVGKITYFPFGNFLSNRLAGVDDELLSEGDFKRHRTPKIAIALGGGTNRNTNRQQSTIGRVYNFARFDYTHGLAEFLVKWQGWSFTTEWISREANLPYLEREVPTGELQREYSRSAKGYFFQLAYLFENNWEIATRWGEILPMGVTDPRLVYSREAGGGVSYYFSKHNLKWQIDYFKLTGNPDRLADNHEIRTQLQLFY